MTEHVQGCLGATYPCDATTAPLTLDPPRQPHPPPMTPTPEVDCPFAATAARIPNAPQLAVLPRGYAYGQ